MNKNITDYIKDINYWHKTSKIEKNLKGIERKEYLNEIFSLLELNKILAIIGIRRSGKSTLLFQTIQKLLNKGIEAKKILYFKIDDFEKLSSINEILETYEILTGLNIKNEECYIFIDEIQYLKDWQKQLKFFVDYKYKSHFIISGSSKTLIYNNATESLVGRIFFINIFPLTFREYLEFHNINIKKSSTNLKFKFQEIERFYSSIENKNKIKHLFLEYLETGAFPEWFEIKNLILWRKILLETYQDLLLYKDIVKVYNIKNPRNLQNLFIYIAKNSGERFSYNKISQKLDIDKETVRLYISYLESAGLIYISDKFSKNETQNEKSEKKLFVWEEGLRKSISFVKNNDFAYEGVLLWHLQKLGINSNPQFKPKYYHKKYEVDYIYQDKLNNICLPIEVKNSSSEVKIKGLLEFMKENKSSFGIVITENRFEEKNGIYYIPLWLFLMFLN